MEKCIRDYTVINSQPSIEALENLISDFLGTFGIAETIDNMFNYGVFCKPENYANFDYDTTFSNKLNVPLILSSYQSKEDEKIDYVKKIISQVIRKEIDKPEWMKYVEMNSICNEYGQPPSTFLYIEAKEEQYSALAQRLIEYLYSPNLNITMVNV